MPIRPGTQRVQTRHQNGPPRTEVTVKVQGLPHDCTLKDVYNILSPHGDVSQIELERWGGGKTARVVFRPAPTHLQWTNWLKVGTLKLTADVEYRNPSMVMSPVIRNKQYPELNMFFAESLDFGVSTGPNTMTRMYTASKTNRHPVMITLDLNRKRIFIRFSHYIGGKDSHRYMFEVPLALLQAVYRVPGEVPSQQALVIPFGCSPRFFRYASTDEELNAAFDQASTEGSSSYSTKKFWREHDAWYRQTDVLDHRVRDILGMTPVMHTKNLPVVDIGRWTTYRLTFESPMLSGEAFTNFTSALSDYGVPMRTQASYRVEGIPEAPLWDLLQEEKIATSHSALHLSTARIQPKASSALNDLSMEQIYLTFDVRYQLEACLSHGFLIEHTITPAFLERLSRTQEAEAQLLLEKVMDKQIIFYNPMDMFEIRLKSKAPKKAPEYCFLARAVNITPTMMHVQTPAVEISNRIIRKYTADADRFIRVKFTDEKTEGRLSYNGPQSQALFDRVKRALENGIVVAGRYYEFLAFGNSQFRENGAYFFAPTTSRSAADIRQEQGQFGHILSTAKFGARLGQCFSTTRRIHSTSSKGLELKQIPDIERNGFTFSDGVGKICSFLAKLAAQELGFQNAFEDPPSLYQFRLAGCKGVLALDPSLQGTSVIHIRPSQFKFHAEMQGLEVIRASSFATAYFNRQLITVLSTLGVPDNIFLEKQQKWMNDLEKVTQDGSFASEKLQRNVDINQISLEMASMITDGFMDSKDPFLMSLLHLWRAYNIKTLKERARIFIEHGAFLLGCVDETATMRGHFDEPQSRPDATREEKLATLPEIFVQVSDPAKPGHYTVIQGVCILARNPSLYAGDLRVVRAVDVPALHHMKNVVVLPQTGDRDLSSMCSGGDLDGDDYLVMWDPDFIPPTINEPPFHFTPDKPRVEENGITIKMLTDFFVDYMKNDSLGKIALAHLAHADRSPEGVKDVKCLELAALHSQAVDYPKSGVPAIMRPELNVKKWPHFMEKKHLPANRTYQSCNVLGKLYNQVELVDFKPQYENLFDKRILDAYELNESLLDAAAQIKCQYDEAILRQMAKNGVRTEFEVFSIFVLAHNQEKKDYKFAEEVGATVDAIKSQFREACREAAARLGERPSGPGNGSSGTSMLRFVAAMYTVTAQEMSTALQECKQTRMEGGMEVPVRKMEPGSMPLISFPWIFARDLGTIATGRRNITLYMAQQPSKKIKRPPKLDLEGPPGEVKTDSGVTKFGEVLKLSFEFEEAPRDGTETHTS
ncbi:RdRP-domain-containing protein, partial [Sporormia fimetaria CBS 119925]